MAKTTTKPAAKGRGSRASKATTPKAKTKAKAKPTTPLKTLKASLSGDGSVVSYILGWALKSAAGDYNELEEMAQAAGLAEYLPSCPTHEARLRRSLTKIKSGHGVTFKRMAVDKDAPDWVTYRPEKIKDKVLAKATDPRFRQDQAIKTGHGVAINTDTGEMVLEDQASLLLQAVESVYSDLEGQFSHDTVSGWLHRVMERHFNAAPFPATGGAHIIPAKDSTEEDLKALQGIVQSIGHSTMDFEDFRKATAMASNAAHGLLGGQWSNMMAELDGFVADAVAGDLTHPTGFTAKLTQAQDLRGRMDLYGKILDQDKAGMEAAVKAMTTATETLLKATTEARSLRKAKGSELASELARSTVDKAAEEARAQLQEAKDLWAPVHGNNGSDNR